MPRNLPGARERVSRLLRQALPPSMGEVRRRVPESRKRLLVRLHPGARRMRARLPGAMPVTEAPSCVVGFRSTQPAPGAHNFLFGRLLVFEFAAKRRA